MKQNETGKLTATMPFDEELVLKLRALYMKSGYVPYRMSRFESYDYYLRNKDFLTSDHILAFTDTDGRLMALKPDVTLSILHSGEDLPGCRQRVCYSENVYRVSPRTHRFTEIMQAGLECIGDLTLLDVFEVIRLAAETLQTISPEFVLDIADADLTAAAMEVVPEALRAEALHCLSEKNLHELKKLCARAALPENETARLLALASLHGSRAEVLPQLRALFPEEACAVEIERLEQLSALLDTLPLADRIRFDFSLINNMRYYNGPVFRGFVPGLAQGILSGGQYDRMMARIGRTSKALGFALYLDELAELSDAGDGADVDVLLLYNRNSDLLQVAQKLSELQAQGLRVSAQETEPPALRWNSVIDLRKEAASC